MTIAHVIGAKGSGKSYMAQSFRAQAVTQKRGTLMVDDHLKDDGATQHLLEKIIADGPPSELNGKLGRLSDGLGNPLRESFDVNTINWKSSPVIIFIGDAIARLDDIEKMVPGFTAKFGPVRQQSAGDEPYVGDPVPEIKGAPPEYDLPPEEHTQLAPDVRDKKIADLEARLAALRDAPAAQQPAQIEGPKS